MRPPGLCPAPSGTPATPFTQSPVVNGNAPTLLLTVYIGSTALDVTHECQALPDSGATRSVVSYQLLSDAGLTSSIEPLPRSIRLRAANGSVVPLDGHIFLFISTGGKLIRADALHPITVYFTSSYHNFNIPFILLLTLLSHNSCLAAQTT